jgi:hypothetical protein
MGAINFYRKKTDLVWAGTSGQLIKGVFNATTAGYGLKLTPDRTWIERGNADDGGKVLTGTGAAYLFGSRRTLLTAVQTGNNSFFGGCDRLSINADESAVTGVMAAHWAMLENKASGKVGGAWAGAVRGDLNLHSSGANACITSCFLAACESCAGTHTADVVVIHVPTPEAGTFDHLFEISSASGCIAARNVGAASGKEILISIDGSPYALQVYATQ